MGNNILCTISTKGRYNTTLPLAIQSIAMQTMKPDELIIFDDNDDPVDIRAIQHYEYLLRILDEKKIKWHVIFGQKRGQHYNHQSANKMNFKYIWRVDDDCVPEPNVLQILYKKIGDNIGAVGGSILTPPFVDKVLATGKIENIGIEPNIQWGKIDQDIYVDHLHCSYLYRAGINDFDLSLSKVAHREETMHTYGMRLKGYKLLLTDCITWHLKNKEGGIRDGQSEMFEHDERIFKDFLKNSNIEFKKSKLIVLDNGIGDHYSFKHIVPDLILKYGNLELAVCYPRVFDDLPNIRCISIAEAISRGVNLDEFNVYRWMVIRNWNQSIVKAYQSMYL